MPGDRSMGCLFPGRVLPQPLQVVGECAPLQPHYIKQRARHCLVLAPEKALAQRRACLLYQGFKDTLSA